MRRETGVESLCEDLGGKGGVDGVMGPGDE